MILIGFYRCALTVLRIYHLGGEHSPVAPPVTSWQLNVNPRVNRRHPPLLRRSGALSVEWGRLFEACQRGARAAARPWHPGFRLLAARATPSRSSRLRGRALPPPAVALLPRQVIVRYSSGFEFGLIIRQVKFRVIIRIRVRVSGRRCVAIGVLARLLVPAFFMAPSGWGSG